MKTTFLSLFSKLYGAGVGFRNRLYDTQRFKSVQFALPIISVGNLAVGGTGKTPHIEYLIRKLYYNHRIGVLSRGYKRRSSGFKWADESATAHTIGDEALQVYRRFPHAKVAVAEDRAPAIVYMVMDAPNLEVILLDDAFQHRSVRPQLSLLLTDYHHLYTRDQLLPLGRLREPIENSRRADIIVVTKCPDSLTDAEKTVITNELKPLPHQTVLFSHLRYGLPYRLQQPSVTIELNEQLKVLLVSAIANPETLIQEVKPKVARVEPLSFSDHHYFTEKDLTDIRQRWQDLKDENAIILTTEKDAMRLLLHGKTVSDLPIYCLPVEVYFAEADEKKLLERVEDVIQTTLNE